LSGCTWCCC